MIQMPDPINPPTYIPTLQSNVATPSQIAEQRAYAKLLMAQHDIPPSNKGWQRYTWANGLNDATAKIMGGLASRQADQMERQAGKQAGGGALGLPGTAPALPGTAPAPPTNNNFMGINWKNPFSSTDES
jgi:hypothetical protein